MLVFQSGIRRGVVMTVFIIMFRTHTVLRSKESHVSIPSSGETRSWFHAGSWLLRSCRLQIVFPEIETHTVLGRSLRPPEFHRLKPHTVHRLGLLASAMRVRIGVHKGAVDAVDDADPAARI